MNNTSSPGYPHRPGQPPLPPRSWRCTKSGDRRGLEFTGDFTSSGGDVYCQMSVYDDGTGAVACEGGGGRYEASEPGATHSAWGDLSTSNGARPRLRNATTTPSGPISRFAPTLDYSQTQSVNTITCDSEPSGITCTDESTGHFITLSAESEHAGLTVENSTFRLGSRD